MKIIIFLFENEGKSQEMFFSFYDNQKQMESINKSGDNCPPYEVAQDVVVEMSLRSVMLHDVLSFLHAIGISFSFSKWKSTGLILLKTPHIYDDKCISKCKDFLDISECPLNSRTAAENSEKGNSSIIKKKTGNVSWLEISGIS